MRTCCLCNKKELPGNGTFFSIPKDEKRKEKWNEICQMQFSRTSSICYDHFDPSQIMRSGRKTLLLPNAVPVLPGLKRERFCVKGRSSLSGINNSTSIKQDKQTKCNLRSHDNWTFAPELPKSQSAKNFTLSDSSIKRDSSPQGRTINTSRSVSSTTTQCINIGSAVFDDPDPIWENNNNSANTVLFKSSFPMEEQWKLFKEQKTQTDPVIIGAESKNVIIKNLEKENQKLKRQLLEANLTISSMKKKLQSAEKINWM